MGSDPKSLTPPWTLMDEELWVEIISRLPMKTIVRFRCVCKSWNSVISSPFFINLHHSLTSSTTPTHLKPYLRLLDPNSYVPYLNELHNIPDQKTLVVEHASPFTFNKSCTYMDFTFVDFIRGVLCLSYSFHSSFDTTILWNPAIHKYLALPHLPFPCRSDELAHFKDSNLMARCYCNAIGFGYDNSKTDFKVVRVWIPIGNVENLTYEVYSTREGVWRAATTTDFHVESCELITRTRISRCFVNGTIHWLLPMFNNHGKGRIKYHVLMFDCEREVFTTMELPQEIYTSVDCLGAYLLDYGGMLSICVQYHILYQFHDDMWAMQKHGVATSWTKLAPYGPTQWIKDYSIFDALEHHVYEETMYLMDAAEAKSYPKGTTIFFEVPDRPCPS